MTAGFVPMPENSIEASGRVIFGPNGQPLAATNGAGADIAKSVSGEVVDQEVEKRVRARMTTLSQVWDPSRGKPKPTPVTYETLRMMSHRSEWVRAIIKTRKNQIGKVPWAFQPKDPDDQSPSTERMIEKMEKLFKRPSMKGSRPHSRSWRQFIGEVLEDLLVLDAGVIEKERNGYGWIVAMYPVDGATIRPNLDEFGGYHDDAYVQLIDGQLTARFGMEDLVYIMDNPQTDVRFSGYGMSPLEHLLISVTAELYASKYNMSYFEKGAVPEGILNLGEDVSPEDVDAFRLYWMNEIMGKPWALPIVGGKGVEWTPWRASNKDMEYMSYQEWLLKKLCAVYQIAPQEVGELEDVNRSTADSQDENNDSKSVEPILSLLKDYIDVEIVGEHGQGVGDYIEFVWDNEGTNLAEVIEKYTAAIPLGAATRAEFREEMGWDTPDDDAVGAEGLDMFLTDGQPQPLPTKADTEVMGAKAQQDQQQQQMEQEREYGQGGGPGTTPWKPADPNDGDFQAARAQHQASQPPRGPVEKVFEDRNPALSKEQEELAGIFTEEHVRLVSGLERILGVPLDPV
jgi:hypothetical protein